MVDVQDAIVLFAQWCAIWAEEEWTPESAGYYLNNYRVLYEDGTTALVDVHLGAFDHGAGTAMLLVWQDNYNAPGFHVVLCYEGDVREIWDDDRMLALPDSP